MIILAVVFLGLGLLIAMIYGFTNGTQQNNEMRIMCAEPSAGSWSILALSLVFVVIGSAGMYCSGRGKPNESGLERNAVYETLSSVSDNNGEYVVVLRKQNSDIIVHLLEYNPPSVFKYSGKVDSPYQIFLPASYTR